MNSKVVAVVVVVAQRFSQVVFENYRTCSVSQQYQCYTCMHGSNLSCGTFFLLVLSHHFIQQNLFSALFILFLVKLNIISTFQTCTWIYECSA